jgi:hypothetical protein
VASRPSILSQSPSRKTLDAGTASRGGSAVRLEKLSATSSSEAINHASDTMLIFLSSARTVATTSNSLILICGPIKVFLLPAYHMIKMIAMTPVITTLKSTRYIARSTEPKKRCRIVPGKGQDQNTRFRRTLERPRTSNAEHSFPQFYGRKVHEAHRRT